MKQAWLRTLFFLCCVLCVRELSTACVVVGRGPAYVLPDFSVEVHDWKGRALVGTVVLLIPASDEKVQRQPVTATTDEHGVATFRNVPLANFNLSVARPNSEDVRVEVTDPLSKAPFDRTVSLQWPSPYTPVVSATEMAGRLRENGVPGLSDELLLVEAASGSVLQKATISDKGHFSFAHLQPGLYFLRVSTNQPKKETGDIAIEIRPDAEEQTVQLSVTFSDCGLSYLPIKANSHLSAPLTRTNRR